MRRTVIFVLALLLLLCACETEPVTPAAPPVFTPVDLPDALTVATHTLYPTLRFQPDESVLAAAVDARIAEALSKLTVSVEEAADESATLRVRYIGYLRTTLSPQEVYEEGLQQEVRGESLLPVAVDPDVLVGLKVGDKDVALQTMDPSVFALSEYEGHAFLFYIEVTEVRRAPRTFSELPDPEGTLGFATEAAYRAALRTEEGGKLLWQDACAATTVRSLPDSLVSAVKNEFIYAVQARYQLSDTAFSFADWLAEMTEYQTEAELTAAADAFAAEHCRNLLVACAVLDALQVRDTLPLYAVGAASFAEADGFSSVALWTWQIGGSAYGWYQMIRSHCETVFAQTVA